MAFLPGKSADVVIGATSYKFSNWRQSIRAEILDVTNFSSGGFKENIAGLGGNGITISGKHDAGNMPFSAGTVYTLILKASASVTYTVAARLETIETSAPVEGVVDVSLTFQSTGSFTPSIV